MYPLRPQPNPEAAVDLALNYYSGTQTNKAIVEKPSGLLLVIRVGKAIHPKKTANTRIRLERHKDPSPFPSWPSGRLLNARPNLPTTGVHSSNAAVPPTLQILFKKCTLSLATTRMLPILIRSLPTPGVTPTFLFLGPVVSAICPSCSFKPHWLSMFVCGL